MLLYIIAGIVIAGLTFFILHGDPPPVAKVYQQPGKFYNIKYWLFYAMMSLRKRRSQAQKQVSGNDAGYGMRSRSSIDEMECVQALPKEHPSAVDAVYFNGGNKDGCFFVGATARRHDDLIQTLLYIRIPKIGLLEMPSLPDTNLKASKPMAYAAGGLVLEPVEPMKRWKLSFNGKMRLFPSNENPAESRSNPKTVAVSFELDWTAITKQFDFDTDLHPAALSEAIAREPWTRTFFDNLRVAHQTHYEQFGKLSGQVQIEGFSDQSLTVYGVRDHSYGNLRNLADFHRYAIQYVHLTDNTCICIGNISMPRTMSRLIIGYVFHANGDMDAVESSDLHLETVGEDGNDPLDFEVNFVAGGQKYHLECHTVERPIFYMDRDWDARLHERLCTFRLNGRVSGYGISEWCYRNNAGKTDDYEGRMTSWLQASES